MKKFTTMSDAGGVKVGNENFTVLIPNGQGDGYSKVIVIDSDSDFKTKDKFINFTMLEGKFYIYDYDCSDAKPITELDGRYWITYKNGTVVFKLFN